MTRNDMRQIRKIKRNIAALKKEITEIRTAIEKLKQQQSDTVQASGQSHPYILRPIKISGITLTAAQRGEYDDLMRRLANIRDRLNTAYKTEQGLYLDVIDWLTTVEPCDLQQALKLHYVDGKSWARVAIEQGRTESAVIKQVKRFFK